MMWLWVIPELAVAEATSPRLNAMTSCTSPRIYQCGPTAAWGAKTAGRILTILEEHGWLSPCQRAQTSAATHRREVWSISMTNEPTHSHGSLAMPAWEPPVHGAHIAHA